MTARVVVDVGNTRIKWGRCEGPRLAEVVALPADPAVWQAQLDRWQLPAEAEWVVSGVNPPRRDELCRWLEGRGVRVRRLDANRQLPLKVGVEHPEKVGIDRLLNAVAANCRRRGPREAAVIVDAGSAVTVDVVDNEGAFRGGAILPGFRLMAKALHDNTALLPLVEIIEPPAPLGDSTVAAMQAGICYAVVGGVERVIRELRPLIPRGLTVYLTGGDGPLLARAFTEPHTLWPEMTLEGILGSLPHE